MINKASELFKNQTIQDIAHHKQRIKDIDAGLLNHFEKSYRMKLRLQSEKILKNFCLGYKSVNLEEYVK